MNVAAAANPTLQMVVVVPLPATPNSRTVAPNPCTNVSRSPNNTQAKAPAKTGSNSVAAETCPAVKCRNDHLKDV